MPIQAPPKQPSAQEVNGFLGVDLRTETTAIRPGYLARALNVDLHTRTGAIRSRQSARTIRGVAQKPISQVARFGDALVFMADDQIYENAAQATINIDPFDPESYTSIISYQGLNDSFNQTYIANRGSMGRLNNGQVYKWGIAAPTSPPLSVSSSAPGTGELEGTYGFVYTYLRKEGQFVIAESNPSPPSEPFTTPPTGAVSQLTLFVKASLDPQVTHIRVFRTQAGGVVYLFDFDVPNLGTTVTSTRLDFQLGGSVAFTHAPPVIADLAVVHNDRVFLADSETNRLWWSEKFSPEYFDSFIDIGSNYDTITGLVSAGGVLGVFTAETKYRVIEHLPGAQAIGSGIPYIGSPSVSFTAIEHVSKRGTHAPGSVVKTERGVIFASKEGVFSTDLSGPDQNISRDISRLFLERRDVLGGGIGDIDWRFSSQMRADYFKGRYYLSFKEIQRQIIDRVAVYSFDNQGWSFYDKDTYSLFYDEAADIFYSGTSIGTLEKIEGNDGEGSVSMSARTSSFFGNSKFERKLFTYAKIDASVGTSDTLSVSLLVDDVVAHTFTVTGNRTRRLTRMPPGKAGYSWALEFVLSGPGETEIYGGQVSWLPMQPQ